MSLLEDFAIAIERNNVFRIESLLENGSVDVNARLPRKGHPPALVFAAACRQRDVVEVLLRFGARIDDTDDDKQTACHVAAAQGAADASDVVALLLTRKPNLELKCRNQFTILERSFGWSNYHISALLIQAGASLQGVERDFLCRVAASSTFAIQTLLCRGVVVSEIRDREGRTPLHLAVASFSRKPLVRDMLVKECGVDLEARNKWGSTCLYEATLHSNADAVHFLIAAGANVQSSGNSNDTPLHVISSEQCAILLLAAGADVHARNAFGKTPCCKAAFNFQRDHFYVVLPIVNVMLAADADLDAVDQDGNSARQQLLANHRLTFDDAQAAEAVEAARREIAKVRLDFVRHRAWQVCIGLQSRGLDALQMCEILLHACGPVAPVIPFHQWWKIATAVKHFKRI